MEQFSLAYFDFRYEFKAGPLREEGKQIGPTLHRIISEVMGKLL